MNYAPNDVEGQPLGANDVQLVNLEMLKANTSCRNMRLDRCRDAEREALVVQFRLQDNYFAYRIAYAPANGRKPSAKARYSLDIPYNFAGKKTLPISMYGVDFENSRKVVSPSSGRSYWQGDWVWNSVLYENLQKENPKYAGMTLVGNDTAKKHQSLLKYWRDKAAKSGPAFSWNIELKALSYNQQNRYFKLWKERNVYGEDALVALKSPEAIYAERIKPIDDDAAAESRRVAAASSANRAYRRFIVNKLTPMSVDGLIKARRCTALPYQLNANAIQPPKEYYERAEQAIKRAKCLDAVLTDYDPDALIDAYAGLLDEEAELFGKTYKLNRFDLQKTLNQANVAYKAIPFAVDRAEGLYEAGNWRAKRNAQIKRQQARERAVMQSFMSSLQEMNAVLAQRRDLAAANVKALQRQGVQNSRLQRRTHTQKLASRENFGGELPKPKSVLKLAAKTPQKAATQPSVDRNYKVFRSRFYTRGMDAGTAIGAVKPNTCLQYDLVKFQHNQARCTLLSKPKLYQLVKLDATSCRGDQEHRWMAVTKNQIIGDVGRIDNLTKDEALHLLNLGDKGANGHAPTFYRKSQIEADSALVEWAYRYKKPAALEGTFYKDETILRGIASQRNCNEIWWTDKGNNGKRYNQRLSDFEEPAPIYTNAQ